MSTHTQQEARTYLIVTGDVETGPGRFARGTVHSSGHDSPAAALAEWERMTSKGLYEEPFETFELRSDAPTLADVLSTSEA